MVESELHQFFAALGAVRPRRESLEDALVAGMTEATRRLRGHAALQFLLAHEPEHVLPLIAFGHLDDVLTASPRSPRRSSPAGCPTARPRSPPSGSPASSCPTRATPSATFDLADPESTRRLVRTFVLPGLRVTA